MRTHEKEMRIAHNVLTSVTCDSCGRKAHAVEHGEPVWGDEHWTQESCLLSVQQFMDGENVHDYSPDLCFDCGLRIQAAIERGDFKT